MDKIEDETVTLDVLAPDGKPYKVDKSYLKQNKIVLSKSGNGECFQGV